MKLHTPENIKIPEMTVHFSEHFSIFLKVALGRWQTDRLAQHRTWKGTGDDSVVHWIVLDFQREHAPVSELTASAIALIHLSNISSPFLSALYCSSLPNLDDSVISRRTMIQNPTLLQQTKDQLQLIWEINSFVEISHCWKSPNQVIHVLIRKRSSHFRFFRILPGTAITFFQKLKVHSCDNKIKQKKPHHQKTLNKQTKTKTVLLR